VAPTSPGLAARVSLHGLCPHNDGQGRLGPHARANGEHTTAVLHRLRAEFPSDTLTLIWDGAPYHRATAARAEAASPGTTLLPLPAHSPDLTPVEALWRWLREDVARHHCHATADDPARRVAALEAQVNQQPYAVADRPWVKDRLDPEEEKPRLPT
jgi:transposase